METLASHKVIYPHGGGRSPTSQEECGHIPLAFNLDLAPALELVWTGLQDLINVLRDLSMIGQTSGVHSAGYIDCVSPDIILRLPAYSLVSTLKCSDWLIPGSNNTSYHGTNVHADPKHEVIVGVLIQH